MRSFILLLLLVLTAAAHPVAQGSLDLEVKPGELRAVVRVSNEQVFVQAAAAVPEPADIQAAWREHGNYLLTRLQITADAQVLTGTVEKVEIPTDHSVRGFSVYTLRYAVTQIPRELHLRQNFLTDIAYAPGNSWEATLLVRASLDGQPIYENGLLTHREPVVIALASTSSPQAHTFRDFLSHGIHHILEGWDHLLFMAALVLAVRRLGELLAVVTAFTIAHTVTLTLSVFNIVRLSPSIVEPMIAASIVVVAVQNIWRPQQSHGPVRLALAFAFGLFHGLGFAGGLLETMPAGESVLRALLAFSLGVEIGHQVVVLPIFLGLAAIRHWWVRQETRDLFTRRIVRFGSAAIALAGCFYLVAALRSSSEEVMEPQAVTAPSPARHS